MDMLGNELVTVERRQHVMIITINRPAVRNAINQAVHLGIGHALRTADADPDVRCVVLTGSGDKAFCAGADLVALSRGEAVIPDEPVARSWGFAGIVRNAISTPVIAAINGDAFGGGMEIALACDLAVAVDFARFGLPEVKRGLFAAGGGVLRLAQQLPQKIALSMMLTGDTISAQRALELHLINEICPGDELLDTAMALANRIADNAPLGVQASKRLAREIVDGAYRSEAEAWERNSREVSMVFTSEDAAEGAKAFREKRAPSWIGK